MKNNEEEISEDEEESSCPICNKKFPILEIEVHVNRCLFLNTTTTSCETKVTPTNKRNFDIFDRSATSKQNSAKKVKLNFNQKDKKETKILTQINISDDDNENIELPSTSLIIPKTDVATLPDKNLKTKKNDADDATPLAEKMRPNNLENYIGQSHVLGDNTVLRKVLQKNDVPSMILWGPPGCGKTTLAHIIANRCKSTQNARFVKLSATMVGVNDVKEVVKVAKNELKFQRKTILFMDEIHRFNKLQQDIFLPHVESGTITLIGATTENPSFSLNNALLSRCRVIVLEKLSSIDLYCIMLRALKENYNTVILDSENNHPALISDDSISIEPEYAIAEKSLTWLAEMCDGDARIALNSLQLAMKTALEEKKHEKIGNLKIISLDDIKEGIKKSHLLYDRKGDQHFDIISALHKSIRASDDNATLYWCTRMLLSGEDPRYICRRLVRAASEDIGLADPQAVSIALSALNAVQLVGMPESDVIIAQAAVYMARATKSRGMQNALNKCKRDINECKGPLPSVPLHLRNAPTKLMKDLGYGKGYNMKEKEDSGLQYMPDGLEDVNYFSD